MRQTATTPPGPAPKQEAERPASGQTPRLTESRRASRRFRNLIVLWTGVVLAILLALSYKVYTDAKKDIEESFNRQQLSLADQAAGRIASFLDEITASLRYSASFLRTVGVGHPGRMSAIAGLYDRLGGRVRVSEVGFLLPGDATRPAAGTQAYYQGISRCPPGRPACLMIIGKKDVPEFIMGAALVAKGDWLYAKVTIEDLDRAFVRPVRSGAKGRAWLIDEKGRILIGPGLTPMKGIRLAHLAEQMGDQRLLHLVQRMRHGERGTGWHTDFRPRERAEENRYLTAFTPVKVGEERWSLAVTAPSSEVVALVRRTFRKGFTITLFGFIVVIAAAILLLDRERRRIRAEDHLIWSAQVFESNHRLQALFDGITDAICIVDQNYCIQLLNQGMGNLLGRGISNLLGQSWGGEGSPIPGPLVDRHLIARTFETGATGFAEHSITLPTGKRVDIEAYTYPISDALGETIQAIVYLKDVTERRELQKQLLQSDRLSIVGKMSAQVAHEVRNPLSAINLNTELLEDELEKFGKRDSGEAWTLLRSIQTEIEILRQVTDDYLKFVRMPQADHQAGDIHELIEELLQFLAEEAASRNIEVRRDLEDALPDVEFDEAQLRVALQNLVLNAFDAMKGGGRLTVGARAAEGGVVIDITDTGSGIPADKQASLFTPFFTTKASGTGLGLILAQQIVHEHRGSIRFASQEGEGTTFHIYLPSAAQQESQV
ncbi:MAG: ATP-binding protein [bacterium]|nr:ATP-binding protein [bacterium]